MGWTGCHATYYKPNGTIDRKAQMDKELFEYDGCKYALVKSLMVGSVYYAAARLSDGFTFGVVALTQTDRRNYLNFYYMEMDEAMLPYNYDCPSSILKLLSTTDNENALEWRNRCKMKAAQKKNASSLSKLPIGTKIQFVCDGSMRIFIKRAPAFHFKHPFWYDPSDNAYIPASRIPMEYEILESA